ncbi:hypothetical protein OPT61_g3868 [Boeremia exigua]|uniref:Uncharacterized protein n=1 Tax=Boeremia exigua TaxID=749465 RepID=A0ACC2IG76_9PLEO|nr:hypothetical protein OPT61_g3868 [Boeremia exigua]
MSSRRPLQPIPALAANDVSSTRTRYGSTTTTQTTDGRRAMQLTPVQKQLARDSNVTILQHQRFVAEMLTLFRMFVERAVARGVDISAREGMLIVKERYVGQGEGLEEQDRIVVEALHGAWERLVEGCCRVAIAEVAMGLRGGKGSERKEETEDTDMGGELGVAVDDTAVVDTAEQVAETKVAETDTIDIAEAMENLEYELRCG